MPLPCQHSSPHVVEGGVGGGFGGIAQFSRGNGREISSLQQIVQHPQPKRKTEQNKKVQIVKGKKTLIISFKVTDSYFQSVRSVFVSFFFWKLASTHPGWKGRCEIKVCCQRTELNGLVTAEPRPFFLNDGLFISGMKCPLSSGDYWAELFARPTTDLQLRAQGKILDSKMKS